MISVEEALERILSYFERLEPESQPITEALGQVLAEDVRADFDIPPLDNTAMDGYAVIAAETTRASESDPVRLSAAGYRAAGRIDEGHGARRSTGMSGLDPSDRAAQARKSIPGRNILVLLDIGGRDIGRAIRGVED